MGTVVHSFPLLRLLDIGRRHGSITIAELNRLLPIDSVSIRDADTVLDTLRNRGISIVLTRCGAREEDFHLLNDDRIVYPV
jgi:Sigma-70 factor, region 1.1